VVIECHLLDLHARSLHTHRHYSIVWGQIPLCHIEYRIPIKFLRTLLYGPEGRPLDPASDPI